MSTIEILAILSGVLTFCKQKIDPGHEKLFLPKGFFESFSFSELASSGEKVMLWINSDQLHLEVVMSYSCFFPFFFHCNYAQVKVYKKLLVMIMNPGKYTCLSNVKDLVSV